jgi:hypothetical protein
VPPAVSANFRQRLNSIGRIRTRGKLCEIVNQTGTLPNALFGKYAADHDRDAPAKFLVWNKLDLGEYTGDRAVRLRMGEATRNASFFSLSTRTMGPAVQALVATASGRMTASAALSSIRLVKNPIGGNRQGACF